jgi:hypothetical protein
MGLCTGEAQERAGDYWLGAESGGSGDAAIWRPDFWRSTGVLSGVELVDLGEHRP